MRGCMRMATPSMPHPLTLHWHSNFHAGCAVGHAFQADRGGGCWGIQARLLSLHAEANFAARCPKRSEETETLTRGETALPDWLFVRCQFRICYDREFGVRRARMGLPPRTADTEFEGAAGAKF